MRAPATLAAARILLAGFATLTAACSRPEISREGTRGSAREPVVMTTVVETPEFTLPLPRGYEDATTELKKDLRELVVGFSRISQRVERPAMILAASGSVRWPRRTCRAV